jgi:hypothetical protein
MKKITHLIIYACLALAFGLMLSCSNTDDTSTATDDTSTSTAVTVSGKVQKGPYVQGTEITVRELDSSMIPTGNTFTGTIDDNTGSFSIKGTLANKIAELAADGYYFNEVSGSLSTAKLALQAFSDLTDSSSVNVNLMTHLEKKRVEYLMDNSKMTFAAAKTQAQTEIMKIFNIDNVTLGNSETLDISKSGDGNAVLLAISAILQSDKTEAELTELLSTINTDIRTDGTLDSTNTKATLVTAMDYLKSRRSTIRSNIESRYSNLGISATIPAFESYAFKLDSTAPTVSSTSPSNGTTTDVNSISATFSDIMDNTTLTTNTFTVADNSSNSVSGTVSSSDNTTAKNTTVTFTPSSIINGSYTATVSNAVKDVAGNSLAQNYSWSFEIKWVGTKQLGTSNEDYATGVATDSSGNVYVTGYTGKMNSPTLEGLDGNTNAGVYDPFVVKYNSFGIKQWTKQLGTSGWDEANGVATDSSGNVYVTGHTEYGLDGNSSAGGYDLFVVKYNSSGAKQWTQQLGTSSSDQAKGVATDSSGNVYVTGYTLGGLDNNTNAGSSDLFVVKYNSSGAKQWTQQLGTSSGDSANGIATDSSGNVYVTGYTSGGLDNNTNAGSSDLFVVKYNSSGAKQWSQQFGSSSSDQAKGVATDSSGNVYVTGYTSGGLDNNTNAGGNDLFVVKYNSEGVKQWTQQLGSSSSDQANGVATDSSGNVYVTGYTSGGLDGNTSAGGYELFVVKYYDNGTKQWTKQLGTPQDIKGWTSWDAANGVATDSSGNVYVAGVTKLGLDGNTNAGGNDLFVVKYNSDGVKQ